MAVNVDKTRRHYIAAGRYQAVGFSLDPVIQRSEAAILDGNIANP